MLRKIRRAVRRILGKKGNRGFTLVELLIAISIIGAIIPFLIGIIGHVTASDRAKAEMYLDHARQIASAVENYYSDKGEWPSTPDSLVDENYLKAIPNDDNVEWEIDVSNYDFDGNENPDVVVTMIGMTKGVCEKLLKLHNYGKLFKAYDSSSTEISDESGCTDDSVLAYLVSRQ